MSVHKISRTNELMYYVTTVAKSPYNTVWYAPRQEDNKK